MIVGIGVDRVAIHRIEQAYARHGERFIQRIYTDSEFIAAQQKGIHRRLAMFFAAKEAVSKALGTGFIGFSMRDIEVVYLLSGKPSIALHGGAKSVAEQLKIQNIHVSLTDDDGVAMAFVVAEQG